MQRKQKKIEGNMKCWEHFTRDIIEIWHLCLRAIAMSYEWTQLWVFIIFVSNIQYIHPNILYIHPNIWMLTQINTELIYEYK